MNKEELLQEIHLMAQTGELTQTEVMAALSGEGVVAVSSHNNLNLAEILYYIGGAIVFMGIVVLSYQNWDSFGSPLRILITLGSSIGAFVVGALLYSREDFRKISQAFFLISGMLAPLGLSILFKENGLDLNADGVQLIIYIILTAIFLGSIWFYKQQTILLFFGVLFATGLFHFIINLIIGQNLLMENYSKIWEYRILAAGLAWIFLGYYLKDTSYKAITGPLYGFGVIAVLGTTMALGGWDPNQNVFWELAYPLVVFGAIFASVYLKSKSFLVFGSIFLIGYILKLTSEYFTSGLGWPLALVLAGLAIMGVGYWAVKLNKKYFSHTI